MTEQTEIRVSRALVGAERDDPSKRVARVLGRNRDEIASQWIRTISFAPEGDRSLEPTLRSLISGICDVLTTGDWSLTQMVIDGLAERRARDERDTDESFQRALISGRHVMWPYVTEQVDRELLLETLHECVFRYYESYQGLRLASENERLHTRIIRSLVMALEARDAYTKGHSLSVALLCEKIARLLDDVDPHHAYLAGLLHDVGKVGIPDRILGKEAPLSDEEWVIMRAHPIMGANILSPIKLFTDVTEGVLTHHENWDGTGYPTGLAGEEIPILGRLIRVTDSFDAMTSTRAFRVGRSISESLREMRELAGHSYDPAIVTALEKIVDEPTTMRELSLASLQIDLVSGL